MYWLELASATGLAIIHIFAGKLRFLEGTPRSGWLSAAAGISVAYVFLYLLPELATRQRILQEEESFLPFLQHHTYTAALIGLALFYGLERAGKTNTQSSGPELSPEKQDARVFWTHMGLVFFYNLLVGYLLIRNIDSPTELAFFFTAMALHLLVLDRSLRDQYKEIYHRVGRWLLSAALLIGSGVATFVEIPSSVMSLLIAFIAGGIVLNVLKEELPEHRQSRFSAFIVGALLYSALLQAYA